MPVSNRAWSLPHSTKSAEQRAASNEEAERKPAGLDAHQLTARWPTTNDGSFAPLLRQLSVLYLTEFFLRE